MKIKKGDNVEVISGDDKGSRGTVHTAAPKEGRVVVSGVNMIKKHQRRTGNVKHAGGHHRARGACARRKSGAGVPSLRQGDARGLSRWRRRHQVARLPQVRRSHRLGAIAGREVR